MERESRSIMANPGGANELGSNEGGVSAAPGQLVGERLRGAAPAVMDAALVTGTVAPPATGVATGVGLAVIVAPPAPAGETEFETGVDVRGMGMVCP